MQFFLIASIETAIVVVLVTLLIKERNRRVRAEELRKEERAGRIKVEQRLSKIELNANTRATESQQPQETQNAKGAGFVFACKALGTLRSVYKQRNGAPRQSFLVPTALSKLTIDPSIDPSALEGLTDYSHCWVIFCFHENTNFHKMNALLASGGKGPTPSCKAKIRPPRLGGASIGVFATRSPHHPSAIGLSLGKIERVEGTTIFFSGLDLLDGTPVLDIKPYVAQDSVSLTELAVPAWVAAREVLFEQITFSGSADKVLKEFYSDEKRRATSFFDSAEGAQKFITEVLSHDFRSVHTKKTASELIDSSHNVEVDCFKVDFTINPRARSITVVSVVPTTN